MILSIVIYIVPIIVLFWRFERYRIKNLDLKIQNDMRKLRNRLRMSAINGSKITKDKGYQDIDYVIVRSEKKIQDFNIWVILYENFVAKKNHEKKQKIMFGGNEDLRSFYNEYRDIAVKYIIHKNVVFLLLYHIAKLLAKRLYSKMTRLIVDVRNDISNAVWRQQLQYSI
jgi:hypothetical protein